MRTLHRLLVLPTTALTLGLAVAAALLAAPVPAHAASPVKTIRLKALAVAVKQAGDPYEYGASGPRSFDCSGLVQFAYRKAGRVLPRTSSQQAAATRRIPAEKVKPGDLVFFHRSGRVYHVALYAGHGTIWQAPSSGRRVSAGTIWTRDVFYGRITRA